MTDEQTIDVGDGRELAFREYGDARGAVVVNCHGGLLCGLDVAPFDDVARSLGLRIVSPDRPGIGASSAAPGRATGDWADDVRALLDALDVERAAVLGWSMGGQYAVACAARLGDRVTRAAVIAGCLPLDDATTFAELDALDRRFTKLSEQHPNVAATIFQSLGVLARRTPKAWARSTLRGAVREEALVVAALPDPAFAAAAANALKGGKGLVEEYRAWARPWGFAPSDVQCPVTIWHGDKDIFVRPAWGDKLGRMIPGARVERVAGAGHFVAYTHTENVLRSLLPQALGSGANVEVPLVDHERPFEIRRRREQEIS